MQTVYLSTPETAKLIRTALRAAFPHVRFGVRCTSYAGGSSIDVEWQDGPVAAAVRAITDRYQAGRFDGTIDLAYSVRHWMLANGSIVLASDPGSRDAGGTLAPHREWMPEPDAQLVSFGATHVFARRIHSTGLIRRTLERLQRQGYPTHLVTVVPATGRLAAYVRARTDTPTTPVSFDMEDVVRRSLARTACLRGI